MCVYVCMSLASQERQHSAQHQVCMLLGVYVLSVQQLSAQKKSTTLPKECDACLVAQDLDSALCYE